MIKIVDTLTYYASQIPFKRPFSKFIELADNDWWWLVCTSQFFVSREIMLEHEKRIIWELIYSDKNQENGFPKTYFKGMLDYE